MHQGGQGGAPNIPAAIQLFERAIGLNYPAAMNNRAVMHSMGQGGDQNYQAAIQLFERAIGLNYPDAMNNRAIMHRMGQGGARNFPAAIQLSERAVGLNYPAAMNNRAIMQRTAQASSASGTEPILATSAPAGGPALVPNQPPAKRRRGEANTTMTFYQCVDCEGFDDVYSRMNEERLCGKCYRIRNPIDVKPNKAELDRTNQQSEECIVCFVEEDRCILAPCGHKCICYKCGPKFIGKECPMCRHKVESFVTQVFSS